MKIMNVMFNKIALWFWAGTIACSGQGFLNLGFETANVTLAPLNPGDAELVTPTAAFRNWQVYWGNQPASSGRL